VLCRRHQEAAVIFAGHVGQSASFNLSAPFIRA
jgi:hypothetical protein